MLANIVKTTLDGHKSLLAVWGITGQHLIRAGFDWAALLEVVIAIVATVITYLKKRQSK